MNDYSQEFELLARAYEASGGNRENLQNQQYGLLLVSGEKLLTKNEIPGVQIIGNSLPEGVQAKIVVKKNQQIKNPIHLCFGVIPERGRQRIVAEFVVQDNASATFLAHCSFPNAVQVQHIMDGVARVGKNARMEYSETHYHGVDGGVEVLPKMRIEVEEKGTYISTFKLIQGAAGKIESDYQAFLKKKGVGELYVKIYGKRHDVIKVKESISLEGEGARGLAKSRIVVTESAHAEVFGEMVGDAAYSRGHVDCMEIVQGKHAIAEATPRLQVINPAAKLTHEAAIGSVDKRQVETLMSRGLSEQEAVDVIVMGLLR